MRLLKRSLPKISTMKIPLWAKLLICIVTCLLVGYIGSISTQETINGWYATLEKPSYNPPNWIFAPVWTTLYCLMGISAALVWHQGWGKNEVSNSLMFFLFQLVLNGLWSTVFFGMQSLSGAMVIIICLWIVLLITLLRFYKISKVAGLLLVPYILWVSFATLLNASILSLNT